MKKLLFFFVLLALSVSAWTAETNKNSVAVLDFKNLTRNKGYDFLEKTISESLITSLQKSGKISLVERQRLANLMDEKKLVLTGLIDQDISAGKKIGTLLKADSLILGSFSSIDGRIEINARLVKVETGEILLAEKISEVMGDKLFTRLNEMGDSIVIRLLDYKSGSLNLDSSPQGAEVKLDNDVIGVTPITEKKMKSGSYTMTLMKEGYEIRTVTVNIAENQKNNFNIALEQKTEVFPYKISVTVHPFQILSADYQPDWGVSFEYFLGWFSLGVEAGGNLFFHKYGDTNAPGVGFSETMTLYYHKFNALAKLNIIPENRFISPYIGAGLGVFTMVSQEYSVSNTAFYYKGIAGLMFFPASRMSVFAEIIYQNIGPLKLNEKRFNFFGDYTYYTRDISLENFLIGLGFRVSF